MSDALKEGEVFSFYNVFWKESVPPGLYQLVMVARDEVGCLVAIRSVAKDSSGEPVDWGLFYNPPRRLRRTKRFHRRVERQSQRASSKQVKVDPSPHGSVPPAPASHPRQPNPLRQPPSAAKQHQPKGPSQPLPDRHSLTTIFVGDKRKDVSWSAVEPFDPSLRVEDVDDMDDVADPKPPPVPIRWRCPRPRLPRLALPRPKAPPVPPVPELHAHVHVHTHIHVHVHGRRAPR